jgi:type IV secretory pathway VirB2 component (pilin)
MPPFFRVFHIHKHLRRSSPNRRLKLLITVFPLLFPVAAYASPFDSGITSIQTLFTSTIARAASLIAIVIGSYSVAHGDLARRRRSVASQRTLASPCWQ